MRVTYKFGFLLSLALPTAALAIDRGPALDDTADSRAVTTAPPADIAPPISVEPTVPSLATCYGSPLVLPEDWTGGGIQPACGSWDPNQTPHYFATWWTDANGGTKMPGDVLYGGAIIGGQASSIGYWQTLAVWVWIPELPFLPSEKALVNVSVTYKPPTCGTGTGTSDIHTDANRVLVEHWYGDAPCEMPMKVEWTAQINPLAQMGDKITLLERGVRYRTTYLGWLEQDHTLIVGQ